MLTDKIISLLNSLQQNLNGASNQLAYAVENYSLGCRNSCYGTCFESCSGSCDDACEGSCYNEMR